MNIITFFIIYLTLYGYNSKNKKCIYKNNKQGQVPEHVFYLKLL